MAKHGMTTRPAVLWFTGLSGSGKSTIADEVARELALRNVDVERLDGDSIRSLFPGTGFTRAEREDHLKRVGHIAALLEKHGVTVIASFVSPYADSRRAVRNMCRNFIEVHVSTPLEECERRDVKGLYGRARRGELKNFTGIDDPYEAPRNPEITLDTTGMTVNQAARLVLDYLSGH
ncbi:MAG: adenylyl-sulfate kinase [Lentisphaerae bacterium]|nr:adenylyl-sulfate kinase [Lentisphaerota bacterium]